MRIIIGLNSSGSRISGELMFTGPCARLEGNNVLESLKNLQKEKNINGNVVEANDGYLRCSHSIQDEEIIDFLGIDAENIIETIRKENKKRFPDKEINIKFFNGKNADTVLVSERCIPDFIEKDFNKKILFIDGKNIEIDETLFELIKELNEKGYKTLYCCSGHLTVNDGIIEIVNSKGYSREKFLELFPKKDHGEKTILLCSMRSLISSGYIMFEYNEKNLNLFKRLEEECPICKNGADTLGIDSNQNIKFPDFTNSDDFSDTSVFYTEYHDGEKKRLVLRWDQSSSFENLKNIQMCIHSFL